jgi:hypothetical protein
LLKRVGTHRSDRVRLHADLTILTKLAYALAKSRAATAGLLGSAEVATLKLARMPLDPVEKFGESDAEETGSLVAASIFGIRPRRSKRPISVRCNPARNDNSP